MGKTPELRIQDLPRKNFIINGAIDFAQRIGKGGSASGVAQGYYWDRLRAIVNGFTIGLNHEAADVPTFAQSGFKFTHSANMGNQSAVPSPAASNSWGYEYRMEGYDFAKIADKPVSFSFWFKSDIAGTFSTFYCMVGSSTQTTKVRTFNYTTAGVWQKIKIENLYFDSSLAPGVLEKDSGLALQTGIMLMAGADLQLNVEDEWVDTTGSFAVRGLDTQTNGAAVSSTDFWVTGLQLNIGRTCEEDFTRYAYDVEGELTACQRYYEQSYGPETAPAATGTRGAQVGYKGTGNVARLSAHFRVTKRTNIPFAQTYDPNNGIFNRVRTEFGDSITPDQATNGSNNNLIVNITAGAGATWTSRAVGTPISFHWSADAEL